MDSSQFLLFISFVIFGCCATYLNILTKGVVLKTITYIFIYITLFSMSTLLWLLFYRTIN